MKKKKDHLRLKTYQDFKKRVKSYQKFFAGLFLFFENSNREIDLVVKTRVTPFLINSLNIRHLTRKSSSGVKSSLCKFV